jgi:hypothetical protein
VTSLHDLQTRILDALLGASSERALDLLDTPAAAADAAAAAGATAAAARLEVYRNTVRSNLTEALHATYPAVWRLVGADYFQQIARDFAAQHPSRSGDLRHVAEPFPVYLALLHREDEYAYLGDVARLELMIHDVLLAPEHAPLDLVRLGSVPPEAYDSLRFTLHPALRLFESPYPVRRIWESNVGSEAEPDPIDLASGGDRLAVLRQRLQLQFHPLSRGEWCWLDALARGEPFAASVETAAAADGRFDATAALRRFVALGAIVSF